MRRRAFTHSPGEGIVLYFVLWLGYGLLQSDLLVNSKIAKVMEAEMVIVVTRGQGREIVLSVWTR